MSTTTVTAGDVRKLREYTGAGMMDCKKALEEAANDFDKAVELLRKKGQKVAAKRQDREASEGLVIARSSEDGKKGVLVSVNCETDFVAKNEEFGEVAEKIVSAALENLPGSVEELSQQPFAGSDLTIEEKITEMVGKIGEKIEIGTVDSIKAETVISYEHPGNKLAALVGLNQSGDKVADIGREVAMQVAAMNPVSLDESDVPQDIIDKELELGKDQAKKEGKPEDMLEKIAQGKLKKFFKENTLLNQPFTRDNKKSVKQYLEEYDKDLTVTEFKRYSLS